MVSINMSIGHSTDMLWDKIKTYINKLGQFKF
nr:MAG TPA: hypothetical protein [Caudoviricetes sp.]